MVEFTGFGPVSGVRLAHQVAPLPRLHEPSVVAPSDGADKAGNDALDQRAAPDAQTLRQGGTDPEGQETGGDTAPPLGADTPTGPPPSFAATLLELESDLRLTLARMNAGGYGHGPTAPDDGAGGSATDPAGPAATAVENPTAAGTATSGTATSRPTVPEPPGGAAPRR